MVQSPSWEANWFAASQEIPHISRNPKVHYRTHKRRPQSHKFEFQNQISISIFSFIYTNPWVLHGHSALDPKIIPLKF